MKLRVYIQVVPVPLRHHTNAVALQLPAALRSTRSKMKFLTSLFERSLSAERAPMRRAFAATRLPIPSVLTGRRGVPVQRRVIARIKPIAIRPATCTRVAMQRSKPCTLTVPWPVKAQMAARKAPSRARRARRRRTEAAETLRRKPRRKIRGSPSESQESSGERRAYRTTAPGIPTAP